MNITLITGEIIENVKKLTNIEEINSNTEIYYELGYKIDARKGVDNGNWVRTNIFKEITDVIEFKTMDFRMDDPSYIDHHNFVFKNE